MMDGHVDEERFLHLEAKTDEDGRAPKVDLDPSYGADRLVGDESPDGSVATIEAEVLARHDETGDVLCALDDGPSLFDARCKRLFDDAMKTTLERLERHFGMERRRDGDERSVRLDRPRRLGKGTKAAVRRQADLFGDRIQLRLVDVDECGQVPMRGRGDGRGPARALSPGSHLNHPHDEEELWPRPVAFYAVSDSAHFIGLVALVNSLRLAGHTEPLLVADCGLEGWQRRLLAPHADVRTVPKGALPHLQKGVLPLEESAAVMVLMDADLIVLQSLAPLLDEAAKGSRRRVR